MAKNKKIQVEGIEITILFDNDKEYISLTDMLKAKGYATETQLSILEYGKLFTIPVLIMADSP